MNKVISSLPLRILILLLTIVSIQLSAQDNLNVQFEGTQVPNFLNICGDSNRETVRVSLNGNPTGALQNITATAHLFKGVNLVAFDATNSSPGITLLNNSNPNKPIFSLPDLSTNGQNFVLITFEVAANCEYVDTLTINDMSIVQDEWEFDYQLNGNTLNERKENSEYRDAFAVPQFTVNILSPITASRVNDCLSRDILVNNSSLGGFIDSFLYENIQGAGIYVEEVLVNGNPIDIEKSVNNAGDTLITAMIGGDMFLGNTQGGGAGDNDGFLDPDETVTITENICVISCEGDRTSNHTMYWGCEDRYCNSVSEFDLIEIGEGAANVRTINSGSIPNENTGYCTSGVSVVSFINDGVEVDAGFGAMIDIVVGIGLGNDFEISQNNFQITNLFIDGVNVPVPSTNNILDQNPLFASDPDGPGGLEDLDGDGFYDDLAQNDTLELIVYYEFDCSNAQEAGQDLSCANAVNASFRTQINYLNQCDERINIFGSRYFNSSNIRSDVENFSQSDAFVEQDTFIVIHTQNRGVFNFDKECGGNEVWQLKVALPSGINPVLDLTNLYRNENTIPVPVISSSIANDTLTVLFDAASTPYVNGEYRIEMGFAADCSADLGASEFPITFSYVCPSCDCEHLWYCGEITGPTLHANIPPCPPSSFTCPTGIQTLDFEINRTTLGYTDATYTTKIDAAAANTKVGLSCDSVSMTLLNIVGQTGLNDSLGVLISYDNIDETMSTDQTFIFDHARIRITNGGNEYFCSVEDNFSSHRTVDSTQYHTIQIGQCISDLGLVLVPNDTIEFIGNFSINPEGPFLDDFYQVPNLRSEMFATLDGVEYACDNFGDNFTLARSQTVTNVPSNNSYPVGCEQTYLNYQLITIFNDFSNYFGNEYRQATSLDSIKFVFDEEIKNAFSVFEAEISIPGHPTHGNSYFSIGGLESVTDSVFIAYFDTLTQVPALNNVTSYSFDLRFRVVPNCQSTSASSQGDNVYQLNPTFYYRDRYYADEIGDGSCAPMVEDNYERNIYYTDPPTFSLNAVSNPDYQLLKDTATWVFQLCNTSFTADAGATWIALEQAANNLEIVSIQDISDPSNVQNLTIRQYGTNDINYFAFSEGLLRANGTNTLEEICNTYRVKAVVASCGTSPLTAKGGWNCTTYSDPTFNPEDYPPCQDLELPLSVTALEPFIDASVINQPTSAPDICDTSYISIYLKNTQRGFLYDLNTQIIIPSEGFSFVPGSFEIAYPPSAPFQSALSDPTFVANNGRGEVYEYSDFSQLSTFLDANGLRGFDVTIPDSNEFVIRYQYTTDCDFTSGSLAYYSFQGLKGCGDTTNFETGETLPLEINGAESSGNKIFDIGFTENSYLQSETVTTIGIQAINTGLDPSDVNDKIKLELPENVTYELGSTVVLNPTTWTTDTEPSISTDGAIQTLVWNMPTGLVQGDTISLEFRLSTPLLDCDVSQYDLNLFSVFRSDLFCGTTNSNCEIDDITSSNNGATTSLQVLQNILNIDVEAFTSACNAANQELITVQGTINNPGSDYTLANINIEYFYDQNGNGSIDPSDLPISTNGNAGPILSGDSLDFLHTIAVNAEQVCAILARIDTLGTNLCNDSEIAFAEPHLINAGEDQLFCTITPNIINTTLGESSCENMLNYTYNWRAIAPATTDVLSQTDIPNPQLVIPHNANIEDTMIYILETTRPNCLSISTDTIRIIRALGVVIDAPDTLYVMPGGSTSLGVIIENATPPFTYNWSPVSSLDDATAASPLATPLTDTEYAVTVTSASGCSEVASIVVITDNAITGNVIPENALICPNTSTQFLASGGNQYRWEADPSNPIGGSLSASNIANPIFTATEPSSVYNYDVYISDTNFPGFEDTVDVQITTLANPEITINKSPISTECAGVTVTLEALGAESYTWESLASGLEVGTGNIIEVNPTIPTTYIAYGPNSEGCIDTTEVFVDVIPPPILLTPINDIENCFGDTIPITIRINEPIREFNINTSNGSYNNALVTDSTLTFNAIYEDNPSQFTVSIQGANTFCSIEEDFEITNCGCQPALISSTTLLEPSCGNADGMITLQVRGAESNYNYDWTPDLGISNTIGNIKTELPAGSYEVLISDIDDPSCQKAIQVVLSNNNGPSSDYTLSPASCGSNNGEASFEDVNLIYTWSDGFTGATRSDLGSGNHVVTITQPSNPDCPSIVEIEIEEINDLSATHTVDVIPNCNFANGQVSITPSGGSGAYGYSFSSGTNTQDGLEAGAYVVTITDLNSPECSLEYAFVLQNLVPPSVTSINAIRAPTCAGASDAYVDFEVSYGMGFDFPADTLFTDGINFYENGSLPAGEICILIRDEGACISSGTCFTIEEVEPLELLFVITENCEGYGTINTTPLGGIAPYTFNWEDLSGIDNTANRTGLNSGNYTLTMTDANSCTLTETVNIPNNCPCTIPDINALMVESSRCDQPTGRAEISTSLDISGYNFAWFPDLGITNGEGNVKTQLPVGSYTVSITDTLSDLCVKSIDFVVSSIDGPQVELNTVAANCNASDGQATLSPADFTYEWEDGSTNVTRDDLQSGTHSVTVIDPNDPSCPNVILVNIEEQNNLQAEVEVIQEPACNNSNGQVQINISGGSGSYTYLWNDGYLSSSNVRENLTSGVYMLRIEDADSNTSCSIDYLFTLNDDVQGLMVNVDSIQAESCFNADDGFFDYTINYDGAFNGSPDTVITDGVSIFENGNLPPGNYCLVIRDGIGCLAGSECFTIKEAEDLYVSSYSTPVCEGALASIDIVINGGSMPHSFNWSDLPMDQQTLNRENLNQGAYQLEVIDANNCVEQIEINISTCPQNDCDYFFGDELVEYVHDCGERSLVCTDLDLITLNNFLVSVNGSIYDGTYEGCNWDTLVAYSYRNLFGEGELGPYELQSWTVGDTTYTGEFNTIAELLSLMDSILPSASFELDSTARLITGNNVDIFLGNLVIEAIDFGNISSLPPGYVGNPTGLGISLDTGYYEIVITDTTSLCSDTLRANITCENNVRREICYNQSDSYCIDTLLYAGRGGIASINNLCEDTSGSPNVFVIEDSSYCVSYTAYEVGIDTACLEICDLNGLCDTLNLILTTNPCISDDADLVIDTIFVGEQTEYCLDTLSLPGIISSIENICPDESQGFVDFFENSETFCLEYEGLEVGKDSACIVLCDDNNLCDTTYFCIYVEPYFGPPNAIDDTIYTYTGIPAIADIKANDLILGGLDTAYLLNEPSWGEATLNLDCSVTYNPEGEICERWDEFQYVICNPQACDTATVHVFIECTDIVIFTAVSPNADGENDVFYIANIEDFPDSELIIMNRWGNKVFQTKNYQNNWSGTWNGDKDLPDGTYFYHLILNDEENREFKGYFELYR